MSWLYRLQQRLSITKNEALTLLSLSLFLLLGTVGRYACRQMRPVSAEYYAEVDSLFSERSAAVLAPAVDADIPGPQDDPPSSSGSEPARGTTIDESLPSAGRADAAFNADAGEAPPRAEAGDDTAAKRAAPPPLYIDLNRATLAELDQLPRVGPRIAERIVEFRQAYGSFRSVDELLSVSGIGPKTLDDIRPHVYVTPDSLD